MDAPSMVHRSGDTLIVRSVVSGDQIYLGEGETGSNEENSHLENSIEESFDSGDEVENLSITHQKHKLQFQQEHQQIAQQRQQQHQQRKPQIENDQVVEDSLPQCKIKRNYSCNNCNFFTQNPRHFLAHLRDTHGEKIIINACKHCLYASRHYQKLVRHMKMVHGSTEGLEEQAQSRKRASQLAREQKKRKITLASVDDTPIPLIQDVPVPLVINRTMTSISSSPEIPNHKPLKCTICDFTTLYRAQLVEHEREDHNKTKFFRCQKCSYVTHIKARFSKHVKYHSMPMIKCVMCDFRTPYKWNLDRHMKNHGGAGPFKCSACNFTADIKQSLTVHEMNHHVPPVGHATGMSMARRRNKVGGTDLPDQYAVVNLCENSNGGDSMELDHSIMSANINNNNNQESIDSYNEITAHKIKSEMLSDTSYQTSPADLSQKPSSQSSPLAKKASRPIPNLIPIQPISITPTAMNLTMRNNQYMETMDELRAVYQNNILANLPPLQIGKEIFGSSDYVAEMSQLSPASNASSTAKRKSTNFFNELKDVSGNGDGTKLSCPCGHVSKCLSEAIIHKKSCGKQDEKRQSISPVNLTKNMGSTRCQYCRHRCKSSADLIVHMQQCIEARNSADSFESGSDAGSSHEKVDVSGDITDEGLVDNEPHPMENKVFVWNKMPESPSDMSMKQLDPKQEDYNNHDRSEDSECNDDEKVDDSTYYGVETAPGYGEVTKKMNPEEEAGNSSLKKVFKCPHCSFWASTASRFHVHIVGHLNKKPFECSLCSYRSNWRWDITKHIRLKTIRDISHKSAKVLMNDETGRRNYTKYNKYITLMKVTEEDGDPKMMKSGEMLSSHEVISPFGSQPPYPIDAATLAAQFGVTVNNNFDSSDQLLSLSKHPYFDTASSNQSSSPPAESNGQVTNTGSEMSPANEIEKPADGNGKKTSFKCKKCDFRHPNREIVLAHVKGHYQQAGLIPEENSSTPSPSLSIINIPKPGEFNNNVYMNGILSAMGLTPEASKLLLEQQQKQQQQQSQSQSQLQLSQSQSQQQKPAQFQLTPNAQVSAPNGNASPQTMLTTVSANNQKPSTASNEHGETDEASSGVTSVNGWRGPAPYRCGHCHQVSNWKHVIQRHCRLKHDGDIRIEIIEKGSNVYQALPLQGSNTNVNNNPPVSNPNEFTSVSVIPVTAPAITTHPTSLQSGLQKASQNLIVSQTQPFFNLVTISSAAGPIIAQAITNITGQSGTASIVQPEKSSIDITSSTSTDPKPISQAAGKEQQSNMLINLLQQNNQKSKKYKCTLCPYETDGKSQFMYHSSFHTAQGKAYHCSFCSFSVTEEHLLTQHMRMHTGDSSDNEDENNSSGKPTTLPEAIDLTTLPSTSDDLDQVNDGKSVSSSNDIQSDASSKMISKQMMKIQELRSEHKPTRKHVIDVMWLPPPSTSTNDAPTDPSASSSNAKQEKCPHCPFTTTKVVILKDHLQCHICVSGNVNLANCDHCDYSIADESMLKEHTRIHFDLIKNRKNVAFYTSYDNLEIQSTDNSISNDDNNRSMPSVKTLFPVNCGLQVNSSDKENKILIDIGTGQALK